MTAAHRRAAAVVAAWLGKTPSRARAHLTWGPTVVVEVVVNDALTVFAKASSAQNVHTEAEVITHVRRAGLPAPEVLGIGADAELPGERWLIARSGCRIVEPGPTQAAVLGKGNGQRTAQSSAS